MHKALINNTQYPSTTPPSLKKLRLTSASPLKIGIFKNLGDDHLRWGYVTYVSLIAVWPAKGILKVDLVRIHLERGLKSLKA